MVSSELSKQINTIQPEKTVQKLESESEPTQEPPPEQEQKPEQKPDPEQKLEPTPHIIGLESYPTKLKNIKNFNLYNMKYNPFNLDDQQIITKSSQTSEFIKNDIVFIIKHEDALFINSKIDSMPVYVPSTFSSALIYRTIPKYNSQIIKAYISRIIKNDSGGNERGSTKYYVKMADSLEEVSTDGYYFMHEIIPYNIV